jgi:uncharacterized protein (DUF4415 family)
VNPDFFLTPLLLIDFISDQFRAAKRGRGIQKEATKVPVSIRLDQDVVDFFRHSGRGWQTKVNEILREYKATH